jgi:large subunit ribosomal protein L2
MISSNKNLTQLNSLYINKPLLIKNKIIGLKNNSGRNNLGRITSFHKGGGHKQKYRKINFQRTSDSIGIVTSIEYDPNRTANIASVFNFLDSTYDYILATNNLNVGDIVKSGLIADIKSGHSVQLVKIPAGTFVNTISLHPSRKGKISRSAGTFSTILEVNNKFSKLKFCSGKFKIIPSSCFCTIGIVSNQFSFLQTIGKAGRSRWLNKRPIVRGVAMNPIDHPHGGGEGKKSGRKILVTPWGKPTKGVKTSKSNIK